MYTYLIIYTYIHICMKFTIQIPNFSPHSQIWMISILQELPVVLVPPSLEVQITPFDTRAFSRKIDTDFRVDILLMVQKSIP